MAARIELDESDVPENLYWLYELVGTAMFFKIIDTAGGEFLYIPRRKTLEREKQRAAIRSQYAAGKRVEELAAQHGYSPRHIRTILQIK